MSGCFLVRQFELFFIALLYQIETLLDMMKGGAFLANRNSYIVSGMENENFYGWGPEDFERYSRWKNLGYKISRVKGNLYHLTHSRGTNSTYRSQQQIMETNKEYMRTRCSSRNEILDSLNKSIL